MRNFDDLSWWRIIRLHDQRPIELWALLIPRGILRIIAHGDGHYHTDSENKMDKEGKETIIRASLHPNLYLGLWLREDVVCCEMIGPAGDESDRLFNAIRS
jgi:hypothetical protein